ncbi:sugar transferase [Pelagibacterium mangrovi]|uniref:sugar transferase n=1 Tax=Pelagibacterium mangrovi TaxID=3119828 RepID=UPI002FCB418A
MLVSAKGRAEFAHRVVLLQSGLPLTLDDGQPVLPAMTSSRTLHLVAKRLLDIVLACLVLLLFLPALLAIALAIRTTSAGPVLFRQKREGHHGKPIGIYKFRTMYLDHCDLDGVEQAVTGDLRVTPIGRFLRRTSVDELPQLINILKGEMSLIGPRPHAFGMLAAEIPYDRLVPYYSARLVMKPGLSGWAQANGLRGPTNDAAKARARIDHDLAYIENFSIFLDIKIILKTLAQEFPNGTGL